MTKPLHPEGPDPVLTLELPAEELHVLLGLRDPDTVVHLADISLGPDDVLPEPEEDPVQVPGDVRAKVPAAVEGVALVHLARVKHGPYGAGLAGGVEGHLVGNVVTGAPLLLPGLDLGLGGLLGELVGHQVLELLLVEVTPSGVLSQLPLS